MRFQNVTLPHISVRTTGRGLSTGAGLLDTYSVSCPPRCLNIRRQKMSQAISSKKKVPGGACCLLCEKISSLQTGLYYTYVKPVAHVAYKIIFQDVDTFRNWHDRLGHPGIGMMRKIIGNSIGHDMEKTKFPQDKDFCCTACALGN